MSNVEPIYNHMYSIAFAVECGNKNGENRPQRIREAILKRLAEINDSELMEAIGCPEDTYIVNENLLNQFEQEGNEHV